LIQCRLTVPALAALLAGCARQGPAPIAYGTATCAHCHMTITDPRFAAELETRKGLIYVFDDPACLAAFVESGNAAETRALWVSDFLHPEGMLPADSAVYLQSDSLATPMGSHLAALRPGPAADSLATRLNGLLLSWTDVRSLPQHHEVHGAQPVLVPAPRTPVLQAGARREIVVDPHGPLRSLAAAVAKARPGDRIVVHEGLYYESEIVIDRPLEIVGRGEAVIDAGGHDGLTIRADSVTIRGLTIQNVAAGFTEDRAAIRLDQATGCVIEGNHIQRTLFGIYAAHSSGCRIANNRIEGSGTSEVGSGNAIHLWYSRDMVVEHNDVSGHRDGIYLEFTEGARIRDNRSSRNLRYGLHFMFSHDCEYADNVFARNHAGVAVMYSRGVVMVGNRFENSRGSAAYGLLLKELSHSRIERNVFANNSVGLYAEGTTGSSFTANQFLDNGWALRLPADASENRFERNRFAGNSFDVATNSTAGTSEFSENYWDHYAGYDLDRDGRGDMPFHPVRLFSLLVQQNEPTLILLRSPFVDLLDAAERALPTLTPEALVDHRPLMRWSP
jgi:nitrous oxidase accessory protein